MKQRTNQIKVINELKKFNENKTKNYLYMKHSLIDYIFNLEINSSSKLLLIYLIKNISLDFRHLYVISPFEKIVKELGLSKPTINKSIKELEKNQLIKLHSGKNKVYNTKLKEFIFGREQYKLYTPNQHNIINLTIFFKTFFENNKELEEKNQSQET
jgi:DNA-binding MarR family transcriptional regulator